MWERVVGWRGRVRGKGSGGVKVVRGMVLVGRVGGREGEGRGEKERRGRERSEVVDGLKVFVGKRMR